MFYRLHLKFDLSRVLPSSCIQKMVTYLIRYYLKPGLDSSAQAVELT